MKGNAWCQSLKKMFEYETMIGHNATHPEL